MVTDLIAKVCEKDKLVNRANLFELEAKMKEMPQVEIPVKHYKHGDLYAREILIPKDTILTGEIHKFDHFDVMISGDITVTTDTDKPKRLKGYHVFNGEPGKKRGGYAHKDTLWITFHYCPFDFDSNEDAVKFLTAQTFEELEMFNEIKEEYLRALP